PASLFPEIFSEVDTSYYGSLSLNFKFIVFFKIQGSSTMVSIYNLNNNLHISFNFINSYDLSLN
ncbi:hypothetical protein, partial [Leptospira noguchii]|uniref:hypothetical protein n=1 Tax=Leptospira noguchii TaxID=28182 RepID=UPI001F48362B